MRRKSDNFAGLKARETMAQEKKQGAAARLLGRCGGDILAVVAFIVISFAYFTPVVFEGKILYRHDSSAGRGSGVELHEYTERTGKVTRWTNSLFSGMPTYQMAPGYDSNHPLDAVVRAYHLWLPEYVWYLFVYLLGFYILLRAFDMRHLLAVLGSIVWSFSTYFLIIIAAGHIWKVYALAYLPPLIAGMVLAYRGRYLWGFVLTAVFGAMEIIANHVQMTYYYLSVMILMVVGWLIEAIVRRDILRWLKATGVCLLGAMMALSINLPNLYHTWQYSQESMRSKSDLVKADNAKQTSSGLDRDYITQWSYGIGETLTLLVPNARGGASVPLSESTTAMSKADPRFNDIYRQIGQYWGEQPGTSGPVYVGALVVMLFILGLFIVRGPVKWALLVATLMSVALSWGKNFMPLTDWFIDNVPMYAKFRTVSSILVVAEFCMPLLAMLALKELMGERTRQGKADPGKPRQRRLGMGLTVSFVITAGLCLLSAMAPSTFSGGFVSSSELHALRGLPAEYIAPVLSNLREMRSAVFTADCWRSLWIVVIGTVLLLLYLRGILKARVTIAALTVVCLCDLWPVNKRYLNNDMFVRKSVRDTPVVPTKTDEMIMQDTSDCSNWRVLNLSTNTFNENETSYFHKSIGGYHAAKLRRYQELIEWHIQPEMRAMSGVLSTDGLDMDRLPGDSLWPVLNMLNMRYVIVPLQGGSTLPLRNPYALGNAWIVDRVTVVGNANEEMEALSDIDLRHEAVTTADFAEIVGGDTALDAEGAVSITSYEPNELTYDVSTATGGTIVFSEIYYPGWTATVDGEAVDVGRVDYVLRAIRVGPGDHKVTLTFKPRSVTVTQSIAYAAYIVLLIAIVAGVLLSRRRGRSQSRSQSRREPQ